MGKPLWDSTATLAAEPSTQLPLPLDILIPINSPPPIAAAADSDPWGNVSGLENQQNRSLQRLHSKGVLWKHPEDTKTFNSRSVMFRLRHGGGVSSDGNCLFTSMEKAMSGMSLVEVDQRELRQRTVRRFLEDFQNASLAEREAIDVAIRHMYFPDLKCGWGIHVVQEIKLIVKKSEREETDSAIFELVQFGMEREFAAESIYKERCVRVENGESWAKYMSVSGSTDDEYDIVTLQYTEDGLLSIDENRNGNAAAFGDDIAIECLATEFKCEIYVVGAFGAKCMRTVIYDGHHVD